MLPDAAYFYGIVVLGMLLAGFSALVGLRAIVDGDRRPGLRRVLRLAVELGVAAALFALLPFVLSYLHDSDGFAWRTGSLLLALYGGWVTWRLWRLKRGAGLSLIALLVFCAVFLTIEAVNAVWWSSLALYAGGLLWITALDGLLFIALVTYAHAPTHATRPDPGLADAAIERMRRQRIAGDPDGTAQPYRNVHDYRLESRRPDFHRLGRDPNRYSAADRDPGPAHDRSLTDRALRSHAHPPARRQPDAPPKPQRPAH